MLEAALHRMSGLPSGSHVRAVIAGGIPRLAMFSALSAARLAAEQLFVRQDQAATEATLSALNTTIRMALAGLQLVSDDPGYADRHYPKAVALSLARACAMLIHLRGQSAVSAAASGRRPPAPSTLRALARHEHLYYSSLYASRQAALEGNQIATGAVLADILAIGDDKLPAVAARAMRLAGGAHPMADSAGLRASVLTRRFAMLAAALVLLDRRQRRARTLRTTQQVAASRTDLRRRYFLPTVARQSLQGLEPGQSVMLMGRVKELRWIQRPTEPFSLATLEAGPMLVLAHRSLPRQGVTAGAAVWALGEFRNEGEFGPHLKVGLHGPGAHRLTCWEDWLADLTRPAYDLYPGTVAVEWEMPRTVDAGRRSDLFIRIT